MNTILSALLDNASELAVFFITAGAAWLKRRYDLKRIAEVQQIVDTFNNTK
jgi:hypothetical protein